MNLSREGCTAFAPSVPLSAPCVWHVSVPHSVSNARPNRFIRRARRAPVASAAEPQVRSLDELKLDVERSVSEAFEALSSAEDAAEVERIRVKYMGKKGLITTVMKLVGKLPPDERPKLGVVVNAAKEHLSGALVSRKEQIEERQMAQQEEDEWLDVTLPGLRPRPRTGRIHPLLSTMDRAIDIFVQIGYDLIDDAEYNREIETDYYCFEALNCPKDHPARDMQDTFYLKEDKSLLMRTQTSSVQARYMEHNKPPFYIIAPGKVYRRDAVDATHTAMFHQIEILAVEEGGKLNLGSLKATVEHFLRGMLGDDIQTRFRGSYFPFTEPSMEVDVFFRGKWLEVLGCGMVNPDVLEKAGIDSTKYQGFAAGFGVERFAMVMHEITDIREFYKNDMQFLVQFMHDG